MGMDKQRLERKPSWHQKKMRWEAIAVITLAGLGSPVCFTGLMLWMNRRGSTAEASSFPYE
jgi:hypothetical protein